MPLSIVDHRALKATLLALAIMVVTFMGAFTWLQLRMMDVHTRQMHQAMQQQLTLRKQYERNAGREALIKGLELRNKVASDDRIFLLFDASGRPLVGDLDDTPGGRRVFESELSPYSVETAEGIHQYVASVKLDDGSTFVMVQGDRDQNEIARSLGRTALLTTLIVTLIGMITAYVLNQYVLDHVRNLAQTARQIMRGQMTARAPAQRRLDAMGGLTATFNEMLDQNEALVTGMRTVTESLAHDLRTPLMRVGRSIAAARVTSTDSERERLLSDAEADATRALQTFNALVDLARAEAGLSRDSMEKLDLGSLATDVAELFEPLAEERGQRLERSISTIAVVGHPQILKQALGNLLENAIKYSPSGSTLRLGVHPAEHDGGVEIVVQDSGPGIPENAREQAVRPFVRLENQAKQPGAGLGLAIAAAVARLHRGRLVLENADPGLRVRLQLGLG